VTTEELGKLEQHPDYERAMKHAPKSSTALLIALGIALTGGGGTLGVVAPTQFVRTIGWCLSLAGVACMAVAVFFASTPLERVLAVVADRSGQPTGERKHYVTLERIDGEKREYRASRELAAKLEGGHVGVAYLKAGFLLEFKQLS
jgi:hypothetical protein